MAERVLIIGLDGATWNVLDPYIDAGILPNIAALRAGGAWGELRSTIPPLSAPAWTTFMTGKNPARHGIYHFRKQGDGDGIVDGRNIDSATLWDALSHAGKRSVVINMPMTYPPRPLNGVMITGLLTPPDAAVFTYPPELSDKLIDYQIDLDRFIGRKPFADEGGEKQQVKPDDQLMAEFHAMEQQRAQTALEMMRAEPWDVFAVVFTATDRIGHYLWQYHLEQDASKEEAGTALHTAVVELYKMIDSAIGELVAEAGDGTTIFLVSDHGMGPSYTKLAHWNDWLRDKGHVELDASSARTVDGWLLRLGLSRDKLRKLARKVPGLHKSRIGTAVRRAPTAQIDMDRSTVVYERIFDPVGGFRINLPSEAAKELRTELIAELAGVEDPQTGERIFAEVLTREECFTGPYANQAPDIITIMRPEYGSSNRVSRYSAIVTDRPFIRDPGSHQLNGVLIVGGAEVAARSEAVVGWQIADIAPTVLHCLGLEVPNDMDGRVRGDAFAPTSAPARTERSGATVNRWPSDEESAAYIASTSLDDEEGVKERLRALGYFE